MITGDLQPLTVPMGVFLAVVWCLILVAVSQPHPEHFKLRIPVVRSSYAS